MSSSVDQKLLKATKFPPEFDEKVNLKKVNKAVLKKLIVSKISEIMGQEDDIVIELCWALLEETNFPDIKKIQIQLTGFLEKSAAKFCTELWKHCLSAQKNEFGVPQELLDLKKAELAQERVSAEEAAKAARAREERDGKGEGVRRRDGDAYVPRRRLPRSPSRSPRRRESSSRSRSRSRSPRRRRRSPSPRRYRDHRRDRSPPRKSRRHRDRNTSSPSIDEEEWRVEAKRGRGVGANEA